MPDDKTQLLLSQPGISRDGTRLSSPQYSGGRWARMYQGKPRKMGGYREQVRQIDGIARQLQIDSVNGYSYVHLGTQDVLQRYTININNGLNSGLIDRTPTGFAADDRNNWQLASIFDTASTASLIVAHAAPNILDITDSTERPVYANDLTTADALLAITGADCSGGVVGVGPYLMSYGNYGVVKWSAPGLPFDFSGTGSGSSRPVASKIVRGMPLRGQAGGPAALFWSLDSLITCQFVGTPTIFNFTTVSTSSAILSSSGVIEHNGIYYWATVSGFSMFNGVMRDLPNTLNAQFFLDNLNFAMRQKVFAFKIPRWSEIWWCFPKGEATECNHAVIYNWTENTWYDTPLPDNFRTAGQYEQIFHYPILTTGTPNEDNMLTSSFQHDFGFNEVSGPQSTAIAIRSWYETHEFNVVAPQQLGAAGTSRALSFGYLEPDFDQVGDLRVWPISRANARAKLSTGEVKVIPQDPGAGEQLTKFKWTGRLTSWHVESNSLDGFYHAGAPLIHFGPSDDRKED